jgi:HD-GYP domain-containing protein (c-di-GMP phosphodiesterase class II)
LGIVVERTRLLEETRNQLLESEAVNRISTALRSANTLDEMLPMLMDETLAVFNTRRGSIWLYDESSDELKTVVTRDWDALDGVLPKQVKPGEDIAGYVFSSGQVLISNNFRSDLHFSNAVRQKILLDFGGAVVPIRAATKVIGVLFIVMNQPHELIQREINLLNTLTEMAGNTIHRMRLFKQTEIQIRRLIALRAIDMTISGSFDLQLSLNVVLDQVRDQLGVNAASILLFDPQTQTLKFSSGQGFDTKNIEQRVLHKGNDLVWRAVLDRKLYDIPDHLQETQAFTRKWLTDNEKFAAYLAVPLIVKNNVKGVLELFNCNPLSHNQEWIDFLETLAGQAAIAIENYQLYESLQQSNLELSQAYETTIEGWSKALDLRDKETEGHTQRVTRMTEKLAQALGLNETEIINVHRGSLLHDIGKMGVPDNILLKPGPLTADEWAIMRQHPLFAYEMLHPISYLRPALDIPYCHHEKWDGTGYSRGLKGENIPLVARIFSVVDVWDALNSDRPYRHAWTKEKISSYIHENSATYFDPWVAESFLDLVYK